MLKESRQWQSAISQRRFFEQPAQSRRDAAGDERIAIAPKIDPRRGVPCDFVHQILADREMAFAKTFFANRVARRIKKPVRAGARGAEVP